MSPLSSTPGDSAGRAPLSDAEFLLAVRAGRGSAVLDLRAHPKIDRTDALVDACLRDGIYDHQCEGSRARWMLELLIEFGYFMRVAPRVAAGLREVPDDGMQLPHVLEHLVGFARQGSTDARDAVIAELDAPRDVNRLQLATAAIDVGGLEQLPRALRYLASQPARWICGDAVEWQRELVLTFGSETLERARRIAPTSDARTEQRAETLWTWLDAYRRAEDDGVPWDERPGLEYEDDPPDETPPPRSWRRAEHLTYDELDWTPREPGDDFWPAWTEKRFWGRKAPDAELERAYAALLGETDVTRLVLLLTVFVARDLPRVEDHVLGLVGHGDERVVIAAAAALGRIPDRRVHALALRRIEHGLGDLVTLALLHRNWQPGDSARLVALLPAAADRHARWKFGYEIGMRGPPPEIEDADGVYTWAYQETPCACCRRRVVEKLHGAGMLPSWMRAEYVGRARGAARVGERRQRVDLARQ